MRVSILDDYFDTLRTLDCFAAARRARRHGVERPRRRRRRTGRTRLAGTEALVLIRERTPIGAALLERLPELRLISQRSVYPPHRRRRLHAARHRRLAPTSTRVTVARHRRADLGPGLAARAPDPPADGVAAGRSAGRRAWGRSLGGKTLGLFGYGRIARVVAGYGRRLRHAGPGVGAARSPARGRRRTASRWRADKEALFERSDVLSVHLRLVTATRGIVTADDLGRMRPTALFVNTSRAGLVERGCAGGGAAPPDGRARPPSTCSTRSRSVDARRPPAAPRQRGLHAPHRLRHPGGVGAPVRRRLRARSSPTPPGSPDQRGEPRGAGATGVRRRPDRR